MPTLSFVVLVKDHAPLIPRYLRNIEDVADEIVVVDSGSTDGSRALLEAHPKVRFFPRALDEFASQKNFGLEQAKGDWIFILDIDELIGERMKERLPNLIRACRKRWYKFPRYWLVSEEPARYVENDALYPDYQLRLFKNAPPFRYMSDRLVHHHFPRDGRGSGKKVRDCHIFHLHFALHGRKAREERVAYYNRLAPGESETSNAYLFEDVPHRIVACEEPVPAAGA